MMHMYKRTLFAEFFLSSFTHLNKNMYITEERMVYEIETWSKG